MAKAPKQPTALCDTCGTRVDPRTWKDATGNGRCDSAMHRLHTVNPDRTRSVQAKFGDR